MVLPTLIGVVLICVCGVLSDCGGGAARTRTKPLHASGALDPRGDAGSLIGASDSTQPATPFRLFSPSSFWNQPLAANAPLASNSAELVSALDAEIALQEQATIGPWINTTSYSVPIYTVPDNQATVAVHLINHAAEPALQSAWDAVPLPAGAQAARGTDAQLVVWQPSTDRLWEFWQLRHGATGWQASWGGAMRHVSLKSGVYGKEAWPGAGSWWGSSASSLSIAGGLITLEDLELGTINHALAMAVPDVRAGVYASPARRDDGKSVNPLALPEGAHLRLNPNLDLAALHLPHLVLMIAEAAQRYGIIVRDHASIVTFYAQDPTPTGTNPFAGPDGYFEGKLPSELLRSFPWNGLQILKMELHSESALGQDAVASASIPGHRVA